MDKEQFYEQMNGKGDLDYEMYLNTKQLLSCQKDFSELCNADELMFQIVHQVQELWMKLISYSLVDVITYMESRNTNRVLTLMSRVHKLQTRLIEGLAVLETMSPKEYQEIRLQLGNGSGQESPGFRAMLKICKPLWDAFEKHYLQEQDLTIEQIYDSGYDHGDAYMVAEALAEYDEQFRRFRYRHIQLIERTIGLESRSLKGHAVQLLESAVKHRFFPELWLVRSHMTDTWGSEYGVVRDSLTH